MLAREFWLEQKTTVLETDVLPTKLFSYWCEETGIEPVRHLPAKFKFAMFTNFITLADGEHSSS